MEKKVDVLVIGGGPAGMVAAVSAKKYYPGKTVLLMKEVENGSIPCGIPYMFGSLKNPDDNKLGNVLLEKNSVNISVDEAVSIDRTLKSVKTKNGETYSYEKLILAVGSLPMKLPIKGIEKKGVFPVFKDMPYLKACVEEVKKAENVLIIGGGFIGVEFADEISKMGGKKVTLVEALPSILSN
jgi:NADPH-dependent 2,4-dienoyl-CoA reductase/sulfur reductase-like enzyme